MGRVECGCEQYSRKAVLKLGASMTAVILASGITDKSSFFTSANAAPETNLVQIDEAVTYRDGIKFGLETVTRITNILKPPFLRNGRVLVIPDTDPRVNHLPNYYGPYINEIAGSFVGKPNGESEIYFAPIGIAQGAQAFKNTTHEICHGFWVLDGRDFSPISDLLSDKAWDLAVETATRAKDTYLRDFLGQGKSFTYYDRDIVAGSLGVFGETQWADFKNSLQPAFDYLNLNPANFAELISKDQVTQLFNTDMGHPGYRQVLKEYLKNSGKLGYESLNKYNLGEMFAQLYWRNAQFLDSFSPYTVKEIQPELNGIASSAFREVCAELGRTALEYPVVALDLFPDGYEAFRTVFEATMPNKIESYAPRLHAIRGGASAQSEVQAIYRYMLSNPQKIATGYLQWIMNSYKDGTLVDQVALIRKSLKQDLQNLNLDCNSRLLLAELVEIDLTNPTQIPVDLKN